MVWTTKPPLGTQLDWTHPLNNGLAAFWVFNEGMGDKVNDLSGNANTGTLTNMAFPSTPTSGWNPGRLGPAIAFDGTNDYVQTTALWGNQDISYWSAEFWVKWNGNQDGGLLSKAPTWTPVTDFQFWYSKTGRIYYGFRGTAGVSTGSSVFTPTIGQWYHFAITFEMISGNDSKIIVYKDGIAWVTLNNSVGAMDGGTYPFEIGKLNAMYHNGLIDEVRIWNRTLSESEIQELYINPYGMFLSECPPISCLLEVS